MGKGTVGGSISSASVSPSRSRATVLFCAVLFGSGTHIRMPHLRLAVRCFNDHSEQSISRVEQQWVEGLVKSDLNITHACIGHPSFIRVHGGHHTHLVASENRPSSTLGRAKYGRSSSSWYWYCCSLSRSDQKGTSQRASE